MVDFLDSVALQDLVDQQRLRQIQEASQANGAGVRVNMVNTPTTTVKQSAAANA
jgi:Rrf2 family iron-sulfur cluster assembly transcriptional regulator